MKNELYRFRCIPNPRVIYMPAEMADVEAMRKHPEYEEVDADGNLVVKPVEQTEKRIPLTVPKPMPAPRVMLRKAKR